MNKPAFTIKAFGYYLIVLGLVLIFSPNILLAIFMMPTTTEVWIRVVGVLVLNIGVYYIFAALCGAESFFKASVYTRTFVLFSFVAFAIFGLVSPMIIFFGMVDFGGGVWTHFAIKSENSV
jgi:hypothetical protein